MADNNQGNWFTNLFSRKTEEAKQEQVDKSAYDFSNYHEESDTLLSSDLKLENALNRLSGAFNSFDRIKTQADYRQEMNNGLRNPLLLVNLSNELFYSDSIYQKIINYYSTMFYNRYVVYPKVRPGVELSSEEYLEKYQKMLSFVDGMFLEATVKDILKDIFIEGAATLYAVPNDTSETITILTLPREYSRSTFKTNYGTGIVEFNFEYFDKFDDNERKIVFEIFPEEFETSYREYQKTKEPWIILNPDYATQITANDKAIPPVISALSGMVDYRNIRELEIEKQNKSLSGILVHQIPIDNGLPILTVDEVQSIQRKLAANLRRVSNVVPITSFGPTSFHKLVTDERAENKRVEQAYNTIFNAAGINSSIFSGKTDKSIDVSLAADKAYVWDFITQINDYINLIINKIFNDPEVEVLVNILPITVYDDLEQIKSYRDAATFGIGKMEAVVATGIKQSSIQAKSRLEDELDLASLLKPLRSSHTDGGNTSGEITSEASKTSEKSEEEEVDN